jgi:hypothetical protein
MTLLDFIKLGLIKTHAQAEKFSEDLVERWHANEVPGNLQDVLGLTHREYQAWTTGGVSLLTIAHWHQTSHPPLDVNRPWFKLSGPPGNELVGYLENRIVKKKKAKIRSARS